VRIARRWPRAALGGIAVALACAQAAAIALLLYGRKPTLASVDFGFGPVVESLLAGQGLCAIRGGAPERFCSHRAPLVPLFLAAVGTFANRPLAALLVKNALLALLATFALTPIIAELVNDLRLPRSQRRLLLVLCALTTVLNPQVLLTSGEIAYEEGYTTWLVAIAFGVLVAPREPSPPTRAAAWLCVAALPLLKSSMLPVAFVLAWQLSRTEQQSPAGVAPRRRTLRILAPFALLGVALCAWTVRNGVVSGRFSPGTSWDGSNFLKGNNELVAQYYPERNLDLIADMPPLVVPRDVRGEWARDDYARAAGLAYVRAHPWQTVLNAGLKARVFALGLREPRTSGRARSPFESAKDAIQVPAMLATRVVWLAALVAAVAMVTRRGPSRGVAATYLAFVGAFALPYVVGFACVRHFVPVVVPTWLFVLRALGARPGNQHGSEPPIRACLARLG
jgi:hypothetical protein